MGFILLIWKFLLPKNTLDCYRGFFLNKISIFKRVTFLQNKSLFKENLYEFVSELILPHF